MLRIVRLVRIIRGNRVIRVSRVVRELCIMVYSIAGAMKSLAWSVVLLCVILLIFGVFFTDGYIALRLQQGDEGDESLVELKRFFDTLFKAMISLYMAMSGGVDWVEIWDALAPLPSEYRLAFLVFMTFAILALLNVITAVFVQSAMQQSALDRELLVQQEVEKKVEFVENMRRVFEELDSDDSGTLTVDEFERQLEDETLLIFLSALELDVGQVRTLVTLLDRNQNGEVDIDEFIQGCLRLKGAAKSLDMGILQYQIEWILHFTASLGQTLQELPQLSARGGVHGVNLPLRVQPPL